MFADAIHKVAQFTRPIYTIRRKYQSTEVIPSTSTLFFVNEDGYALTAKHVVQTLIAADHLQKNYMAFKKAKDANSDGRPIEDIEAEFKLNPDRIVQMASTFVNCVDQFKELTFIAHPTHDLALIQFKGFNKIHCPSFPRFMRDDMKIRQGNYLCRAGYPFPDFKNYQYNQSLDKLEWTGPAEVAPLFPVDGMVTRFLVKKEPQNELYGIEMSTPGMLGHSGAPLFNHRGTICGMHFATIGAHMGLDVINKQVYIQDNKRMVSNYPFMYMGQCIHGGIIKKFLKDNNVRFYEEQAPPTHFTFNAPQSSPKALS